MCMCVCVLGGVKVSLKSRKNPTPHSSSLHLPFSFVHCPFITSPAVCSSRPEHIPTIAPSENLQAALPIVTGILGELEWLISTCFSENYFSLLSVTGMMHFLCSPRIYNHSANPSELCASVWLRTRDSAGLFARPIWLKSYLKWY